MKHILVIDDDPATRYLVKSILEDAGFTVLLASGGEEGLEMFQHHQIALVITDILMPGTDGLAVIRELMATCPTTPVIALSGGGMILTAETSLHIARKMGAFRTMAKPFVRMELLQLINEVLHNTSAELQSPSAQPSPLA
ncbi:response regulator [Candidatus Magnetaquicoccus inordinatus]|uniref:response regulator n=1 Tax=Candidatus Magnetaquicoccus inordinatus TaxID=2496818 RepID=UPI00102C7A17|nr:response regulator [Candidatus Magnetaquicoccus inordinatus]